MNLYLAESGGVWGAYFKSGGNTDKRILSEAHLATTGGNLFSGANLLQSFYYCNEFTEKEILPYCKRFLLDSGAFTFFSSGKHVDWAEYVKRYAQFIIKNDIKLFFELDIDALIGYEKVLYYRATLEELTGKKCIPVWHKSRGMGEYCKMCEAYDYVAIGGIVTKEITREEYPLLKKLCAYAKQNGTRVHGLGFTEMNIAEYGFYSCDSTTWNMISRFGKIYRFTGDRLRKVWKSWDSGRTIRIKFTNSEALAAFTERRIQRHCAIFSTGTREKWPQLLRKMKPAKALYMTCSIMSLQTMNTALHTTLSLHLTRLA